MTAPIITLVDGSAYAASVCEHAAWVSARTGAPVELLHVLGRREGAVPQDLSGAIRLGARTRLLEELSELDAQRARLSTQQGRAILEDAAELTRKAGATQIRTRLMHGDLIETVAELEPDARAIVIGKRGAAADFAKGHLGSNLERIARVSHKPVLVASRAFQSIDRALIAFDGGESAMKAVRHVASSPLYDEMDLSLITVGEPSAAARARSEAAIAMLEAAGRKAAALFEPGEPEIALPRIIADRGIGLLVMGAYGHSRIRSMMIGSTTTEMVRSCKVPVALYR